MRGKLLAFVLLVLALSPVKGEPIYPWFRLSDSDVTKITRLGASKKIIVSLSPSKAAELMAFTERNVGKKAILSWTQGDPLTNGNATYSIVFFVSTPIRTGLLPLDWPYPRPGRGALWAEK